MHSARGNRLASIDQVSSLKPPLHFGTGFGAAKNGWNNNIWANTSRSNPFADGAGDAVLSADSSSHSTEEDPSFEGKTGSGSLLSTSESDGWNGRSGVPWPTTVNETSPHLSKTNNQNISPLRQRSTDQSYFNIPDANGRSKPPFVNRLSFGQIPDHASQDLQPSSMLSMVPNRASTSSFSTFDDSRPNEEQQPPTPKTTTFGSDAFVCSAPSFKHYANTASDPTLRNGAVLQSTGACQTDLDMQSGTYFRPSPFLTKSNIPHNNTSRAFHGPYHSIDASLHGNLQGVGEHAGVRDEQVTSEMERLNLRRTDQITQRSKPSHRPTLSSHAYHDTMTERSNYPVMSDERFSPGQFPYIPEGSPEHGFQYPPAHHPSTSFDNSGSSTPSVGVSCHELNHPLSSTASTPSLASNLIRSGYGSGLSGRTPNGEVALLEKKLLGLQPYQIEQQSLQPNPLQMRPPYQQHSNLPYQPQLQMNPLARPYAMPPYSTYPNAHSASLQHARYSRAEPESTQVIRSPLLEDFRTNSKTNKRYELKDIYNHVVEFSGDQYGSRFIQQKLETANSDEKDRVFSEIQPNSIQLMTDIFGNYVIQKVFEHGNQAQKKILANQMKGHVMTLSTQMYGCRVVQKALEHVLVDQQACIVKELENNVLRCVKDQNGNHVIQKAIERVPAQHVQFIINAFREQVQRLSTHPYGCRVIQRMLEHCKENARRSILAELHGCVPRLIIDQFGNYVIQHVIENGEEKDRFRIVAVVISQLFMYSRHKFASNVVEKSIEFGEPGQKAEILRLLTANNDKGESAALALVRDQYGNYVIQKVLGHLKGREREGLVEQIRAHLVHLKKFNYGKQVAAIEKLIYSTDIDSNPSASSQSSSLPSTNTSTVEGPIGSTSLVSEHTATPTPTSTVQT